ncbi:arylamine N-acetyltransferase family protein [Leptospira perdikensis]|uniref:Arylamine N-acetyltransferase n=1 Tax=Leptospira perdikensis TaxID=2484948 RepID=A0A4R9JIR6_9LEPT|nr:arylamine N-acetyltransferase [Leptospira perdikensis]TGL41015.1 arylamine N-acetyltransferase [Leptospira perdikensis]
MNSNLFLDAYFDRIGHSGARLPSLELLNNITNAHVQSIPFENLDILLGKNIDINLESIFEKLVIQRRGGYCFEQNGLLFHVLKKLGFEVTPISARVRLDKPRDFTPPRTHVFLRVELQGNSWLADVGVGGVSLTSAIQLIPNIEQETNHETRRILHDNGKYFHQVLFPSGWIDVCEFTLEEMPEIDRELANWFTSTHPKSHFRDRLIVAQAGSDGKRYTLVNRELSERDKNGIAYKTKIDTPEELLQILKKNFNLMFPIGTKFNTPGLQWDK